MGNTESSKKEGSDREKKTSNRKKRASDRKKRAAKRVCTSRGLDLPTVIIVGVDLFLLHTCTYV